MMKTTNWTRNLMLSATLAAFLGIPAMAADVPAPGELQALAESASTTTEHANVAREYRLRGQAFQAEAEKIEASIGSENRVKAAMHRKWPGMASRASKEAKKDAIEARRAAQESFELADHHIRLSVEALASSGPSVSSDGQGD